MRRIYFIWILRKIFSPPAMKVVLLFGLFQSAQGAVSVKNVIANSPAPYDIVATYSFMKTAFSQTEFLVQIVALGMITVLVWLLSDSVRHFANARIGRMRPAQV